MKGISSLRKEGIKVELHPDAVKWKAIWHADKRNIPFAVIVVVVMKFVSENKVSWKIWVQANKIIYIRRIENELM
jgi:histidyl-tRNA synthetase